MKQVNVLLIGVGGYGECYVRELAARGDEGNVCVVGVVDPFADKSREYETVKGLTSAFYNSVEEFYAEKTADLAVISTPIPLHASQTIYCLEHGSDVLVEKPIAATVEDALRMAEARDRTGRKLAVGFQWCYDPAMLAFRNDVQAGVYGKIVSMRALVLWPRDTAYYTRGSGWAGKKYDKRGNPIFDSVASNATAHYLENMLWVSGCELTDVEVATARANPIETYDTIMLRGKVGEGDLTFVASHAAGREVYQNPMFEYVFEKGRAVFGGYGINGSELIVYLNDGSVKNYGQSFNDNGKFRMSKFWSVIDAVREGGPISCTAEEGMLHTRAMEKIWALVPDAYVFPEDKITIVDGLYWVPGLGEMLKKSYETRAIQDLTAL